jgi:hypothetical protein
MFLFFLLGLISCSLFEVIVTKTISKDITSTAAAAASVMAAEYEIPLQLDDDDRHNGDFYGSLYLVHVYWGTPPIERRLIVDTGSRWTALVCDDLSPNELRCNKTRSTTRRWNACGSCQLLKSKSTNENNFKSPQNITVAMCRRRGEHLCQIVQRYTEGSSWIAYEANDMISLGGNKNYAESIKTIVPLTVGCQTDWTGLFRRRRRQLQQHQQHERNKPFSKPYANDGILGLEISLSEHSFLPLAMYRHGVIRNQPSFSLCLNPSTNGYGGGSLGFGGAHVHRHVSDMQFTPMAQLDFVHSNITTHNPQSWRQSLQVGMYVVRVTQVWMGDILLTSADMNPQITRAFNSEDLPSEPYDSSRKRRGTIIDSGTTDTYLPQAIRSVLSSAWHNLTGRSWPEASQHQRRRISHHDYFDEIEFRNVPDLVLVLEGNVRWVIPAKQYMKGAHRFEELATHPSSTEQLSPKTKIRLENRLYTAETTGAVLGINALWNHDVWLDIANRRIGIAQASCA